MVHSLAQFAQIAGILVRAHRGVVAAIGIAAAVAPAAIAQPANDLCTNAAVLPADTVVVGNNLNATGDVAASSCGFGDFNDVWYRFTALTTGTHVIDTAFSAFDTTLSVFDMCGGTEIACNDDVEFGDPTSLVLVHMTPGQSIRIRIAGFAGDEGNFEVYITAPSSPPTGACCVGSSCSATTEPECTGPNTRFAGVNTICNAPGDLTIPCCKADFDQSGATTLQDLFDYLGAWFDTSPSADINGGGVTLQDLFDYLTGYFAQGC